MPGQSGGRQEADFESYREGHDQDTVLAEAVTVFEQTLRRSGRAEATVRAYRVAIGRYQEGGLDAALSADLSPATRTQRYRLLSRFFRWAIAEGYIDADPLRGTPVPKVSAPVPRAIPADALATIAGVVSGLDLAHRAAFTLMLETGLREAETVGIRVRDVDLETLGREGLRVLGKGRRRGSCLSRLAMRAEDSSGGSSGGRRSTSLCSAQRGTRPGRRPRCARRGLGSAARPG